MVMAKTVEIPIRKWPNGREYILASDVFEYPEIEEFVERFSNYWKFDMIRQIYVGPYPDEHD